jgi:geranylgeranyl diphosphate synthase type I
VAVSTTPRELADLRDRVQPVLDAFVAAQVERLRTVSDELAPFVDAVTALLTSGKRLRPAFCYWGWRGAGGPDDEAAVRAATALELLHASAIVHDDVMDESDTRRGRPATHRRFADLHRGNAWLGSPELFGVGAAILVGDLCLSWADELLYGSGLPAPALRAAKPVYDEMRTELMAGQYLDLLEQVSGDGSVDRAMRVLRYKSAKYTVERPLHLGAALAGAPEDGAVRAVYTAYGLPVGEAFQLRDDLLGVFGDPEVTGKPAGDDLREGKRTVLVGVALERAGPAGAALLRAGLGDPELDDAAVDGLRAVISDSGARQHVELLIAHRVDEALGALVEGPLADPTRRVLSELAVAATSRQG